jgi:hypothetical protein
LTHPMRHARTGQRGAVVRVAQKRLLSQTVLPLKSGEGRDRKVMENRVERKRPRLTLNPLDAEEKDQKALSITAAHRQRR